MYQEEFPEVYQILPPEGQVNGFMEWSFLDEEGNETEQTKLLSIT